MESRRDLLRGEASTNVSRWWASGLAPTSAPQIVWHAKHPVFSVDFEPANDEDEGGRLATCGGDHNVRLWRLQRITATDSTNPYQRNARVEFLANLNRHSGGVNCVRWSPKGSILASCGDDGCIILWHQNKNKDPIATIAPSAGGDEEYESVESWGIHKMLRGTCDVYDLAWSPDASFILAGFIDNSARIFTVAESRCVTVLSDHQHFVQGVTWDPLDQFIATQSCDRSVNIYTCNRDPKTGALTTTLLTSSTKRTNHSVGTPKTPAPAPKTDSIVNFFQKKAGKEDEVKPAKAKLDGSAPNTPSASFPTTAKPSASKPASTKASTSPLYHNESLTSFFRRLQFSPDGALLVAPAGIAKVAREVKEAKTVTAEPASAAGNTSAPPTPANAAEVS
ncbi:hypothetical protein HK101_010869, partial [Irineochytrium annulatum]